ncbi:DUF1700 domain-containing protein [Streptobacillus ratti]|uniref:DUF1700 domain-containing protein n=1 Tax=Streptobacillus ratti TaxID=1720557 RepID=UPI0009327699|nr:DUF1700 domain-containing protein [Streptobacillus ratti]
MTKREFMRKLDNYLKDLYYYEKKSIFDFYEEYFADLGINEDDEIPSDMDPKKISRDILIEFGEKNEEKRKRKTSLTSILLFLGGILSAPIAIPVIFLLLIFIPLIVFLIIGLISMPFIILWSVLIAPFKYISSGVYGTTGYIFLIIGLSIIFIPIFLGIIRRIFSIISNILMKIYASVTKNKKSSHTYVKDDVADTEDTDNEIKFDIISKIKCENILGNVTIKKGKENRIVLGKMVKEIVVNKTYIDGVLTLSMEGEGVLGFKNLPNILIEYNEENLNFEMKNLLGNLNYSFPNSGIFEARNIVGKLKVDLDDNEVDIKVINKLGLLEIGNRIVNDEDSMRKIRIDTIFGKVEIF